ncbi:MAG: shikimate dehydrogenase [Alphaproteobacteria bacterium]|nr:shikimate dehydrogenase [Alphaproteobacteria bacterium]
MSGTESGKGGDVLRAGVMGWPVSHSLSPRLHGYWLSRYRIRGSYDAIAVEPENLAAALSGLADDGLRGVNLTVPHKIAALALVDKIDDTAQRIGAINTIVVDGDGALAGSNTDAFGFIENLRDQVPDHVAAGWSGRPVAVLGAGGAARAVCTALLDCGVAEIRLVNRTAARATELAETLPGLADRAAIYAWADRAGALAEAGLLVNTTVLGMAGQASLELDLADLPGDATVNDIVYAPLETALLAQARQRGNAVVDGLGMLLHQARPGFRAWFGADPVVDDGLRQAVLAGL